MTVEDNKQLQRLIRAYDLVAELGNDKDVYKSKRVSQFSDSIVVSYIVEETSAVFDLINDISLTVVDLANWGYLVRGAVTVGPLLHDKKHLVGPAMVTAYEMESQKARFPRVIVDRSVIAAARKYRVDRHTADEEEDYVRSFLAKDKDGWYFIDYISFNAVVAACGIDTWDYGDYLKRIAGIVERLLQHKDAGVREKGLWLHKRYLSALRATGNANQRFRAEYSELCHDIANLPRFTKLARQAKLPIA